MRPAVRLKNVFLKLLNSNESSSMLNPKIRKMNTRKIKMNKTKRKMRELQGPWKKQRQKKGKNGNEKTTTIYNVSHFNLPKNWAWICAFSFSSSLIKASYSTHFSLIYSANCYFWVPKSIAFSFSIFHSCFRTLIFGWKRKFYFTLPRGLS